jgi:enoyl-CoA hydratase
VIEIQRLGTDLVLLRLQRPEQRNALSFELIEQLTRELRRVDANSTFRGVVLAGAGPSFSAGVDLHEFADATPDTVRALITALRELCATVRQLSKPVVCGVQGHCLGGALELAACSDLRVSTSDAQFGMPEVFVGIPSVIDAVMLGHLIGVGRARELLLTGESVSGETAFNWGLVNRLAAEGDVVRVAADLLRLVTRHLPQVIAAQKRLHQQWLDQPYTQAVERSTHPLVDAVRAGQPQPLAATKLHRR